MEEEPDHRWQSYADYESIVETVAQGIDRSIDAFGYVSGAHSQGIKVTDSSAIRTKQALLWAGMRLKPEVKHNAEKDVEPFGEIWERWEGENGYVAKMYRADLQNGCPGWVFQYVEDVTTAGWEIGYLKAGREEAADPGDDDVKVREVID